MNKRSKAGLSLVETVLSIAILAVLIVGFIGLFNAANRILNRATQNNQSSMKAQSQYEKGNISRVVASNVTMTFAIDGYTVTVPVDVNEYQADDISYQGVARP